MIKAIKKYLISSLISAHAYTVPPSENASLVFFTQDDMRRVDSNGVLLDHFVSGEVSAIEIWHRNRTVCAMYSSAWTTVSMRCHRIDDMNVSWPMPLPGIVASMLCKYTQRKEKIKFNIEIRVKLNIIVN